MKTVKLEVTARSTKWGLHTIIFTTMCERDKVLDTLVANGYSIKRIDDPTYVLTVTNSQ